MLIRRQAFDRVGSFPTEWTIVDLVDWYARAQEQNLRELMPDEVVLRRLLHGSNIGRSRSKARTEYASAIGAVLRRRRKL